MSYIIFEKLHLYMSINRLNARNNQFLGNLYCVISVLLDIHKKKKIYRLYSSKIVYDFEFLQLK